jgi:Ca2+-binding EF-hand superfamily protein
MEVFKLYDFDKDGKINHEELTSLVNDLLMLIDTIMRAEMSEAEQLMNNAMEAGEGVDALTKKMFEEIDTNKNGFIDWEELVNYMCALAILVGKPPPTPESLRAVFV